MARLFKAKFAMMGTRITLINASLIVQALFQDGHVVVVQQQLLLFVFKFAVMEHEQLVKHAMMAIQLTGMGVVLPAQ